MESTEELGGVRHDFQVSSWVAELMVVLLSKVNNIRETREARWGGWKVTRGTWDV